MSALRMAFGVFLALGATAAALWSAAVSHDSAPARVRIAVATPGAGPYWQRLAEGAEAAARDSAVELEIEILEGGDGEHAALIEKLQGGKHDGVVFCTAGNVASADAIGLVAEHTNVVTIGEADTGAKSLCHIGVNHAGAGRLCAAILADSLPAGGDVVVLAAGVEDGVLKERMYGLKSKLRVGAPRDAGGAKEWRIVEVVADGESGRREDGVREALARHPDVARVVAMDSRSALAAIAVLREEGKLDRVKVAAFGRSAALLDAVAAGEIEAAIADNPFTLGATAVHKLAALCRAGRMQRPEAGICTVNVLPEAVRRENVAEWRARMKSY